MYCDLVAFAYQANFSQNSKMLCFTRLSLALLLAMGTGIVKTAGGHIIEK
jgi:hypothetical protein